MVEIYKGVGIKHINQYFKTLGLINSIDYELKVKVSSSSDSNYLYLIKYVIDYISAEKAVILPNQTIAFNSWVLNFIEVEKQVLEIYELSICKNDFITGAEYSLKLLDNQVSICEKFSSKFSFPSIKQKIVISKGVLDNLGVEAVRYPSPQHMSGWWITTDLYNGDINTLLQVDFYELSIKRPDLLKYLALENGFRFFVDNNDEEVFFDDEVLK